MNYFKNQSSIKKEDVLNAKRGKNFVTPQNKTYLLLCFADTIAQNKPVPYFSLGGSNEGVIIQAGGFKDSVELQIQYKAAKQGIPSVASVSIGYKLFDWITPLFGFAHYHYTDIQKFANDPLGIAGYEYFSGFTPIVGLEVRHTWWFVKVDYCRNAFYSIGFKFHKKFKSKT
jgi:hypothetical protein